MATMRASTRLPLGGGVGVPALPRRPPALLACLCIALAVCLAASVRTTTLALSGGARPVSPLERRVVELAGEVARLQALLATKASTAGQGPSAASALSGEGADEGGDDAAPEDAGEGDSVWEASRLRAENARLARELAATRAGGSASSAAAAPAAAAPPAPRALLAEELVTRVVKRSLFPHPRAANPLRRAWVGGGLDWHNLVRPPPAAPPSDPAAAWRRAHREAAKAELLALLQGFTPVEGDAGGWPPDPAPAPSAPPGVRDEAALRALRSPATNHGPWAKYAACGVARDKCMVHATARACAEDELCGWCPSLGGGGGGGGVCLDRLPQAAMWPEPETGAPVRACPGPLFVARESVPSVFWGSGGEGGGARPPAVHLVGPGSGADKWRVLAPRPRAAAGAGGGSGGGGWALPNCSVVVTRRRPLVLTQAGDAKMAYHFWTQAAPGWFAAAAGGGGLEHLRQHVWVPDDSGGEYVGVAHAFTDSCARRVGELPPGARVCYAGVKEAPNALGTGERTLQLAGIDHATGELVAPPLPDPPPLEPLGVALAGGFRLGVAGAAAAIRAMDAAAAAAPEELAALAPGEAARVRNATARLAAAFHRAARSGLPGYLVYTLGLWDAHPAHVVRGGGAAPAAAVAAACEDPPTAPPPLVALLTRRNKRLLLNEPEVVTALLRLPRGAVCGLGEGEEPRKRPGGSQAVAPWGPPPPPLPADPAAAPSQGVAVEVAALEDMPLYAQLALLRRASVLVGVHGSGLVNALFMHPGTALLQVMPRGVANGGSFFEGPAAGAGVHYFEVTHRPPNATAAAAAAAGSGGAGGADGEGAAAAPSSAPPDDSRDVQHWHFLDRSYAHRKRELLDKGSEGHSQAVFFSFFINRDMVYPAGELARAVARALRTAVLAPR